MTKTLIITPKGIAKTLLIIVSVLLVLHLIGSVFLTFVMGYETALSFIPAFYFGDEANVPAIYSSLAIFLAAVFLYMIGNLKSERQKKNTVYWKIMSGIFAFLAVDELISIHERLSHLGRAMVGATITAGEGSIMKYAWFVPYLLVFGVISLFFLRFFFSLPFRTRVQFVIAGVVFVAGAVGMEAISGYYSSANNMGVRDLPYTLMVTVEELLEMLGMVYFIYALASYYIVRTERGYVDVLIHATSDNEEAVKIPAKVTETPVRQAMTN
jgi:hypothetical protein